MSEEREDGSAGNVLFFFYLKTGGHWTPVKIWRPHNVLFLLLLVEGGVPLLPELRHLLLVAQLALRLCLGPQRCMTHLHF